MDKAVRNKNAGIVLSGASFSQCENCTVRRGLNGHPGSPCDGKLKHYEEDFGSGAGMGLGKRLVRQRLVHLLCVVKTY